MEREALAERSILVRRRLKPSPNHDVELESGIAIR